MNDKTDKKLIDKYIEGLDDNKKEWVELMVNFMREVFPELEENFHYKMPTYKGENYYIAFAAQKNYFSFYTDDTRVLPLIKDLIPSTSLGKSCVRIKYSEEFAIDELIGVCKEIVDYNKSQQSTSVSDIKALKKWSKVSADFQKKLIDNVFCRNCGVTTIIDYAIHDDRFGIVLKGQCKKCGASVARMVEDI